MAIGQLSRPKYQTPGINDVNLGKPSYGGGTPAAANSAAPQLTPWSEEGARAGQQEWAINQKTGRPFYEDRPGGSTGFRADIGPTGPPKNIFDMFPQWENASDYNRGRFANKAVYDQWASQQLANNYKNLNNDAIRAARGFPSWWKPGMAPIYSEPSGGGGFGGGSNVTTGIDAGPVYDNQQVDQAYTGTASPTSQPVTGTVGNPLSQYMSTLQGIYGQQDAVNLARGMAQGNASQSLASQRARAGAGLDWANLGFGDYSSQVQNQSAQQNALLSLLQGLI